MLQINHTSFLLLHSPEVALAWLSTRRLQRFSSKPIFRSSGPSKRCHSPHIQHLTKIGLHFAFLLWPPPQSSHPAKLEMTQCLGLFVLNVGLRWGWCYFFRHRLTYDFCLNKLFIAHAASIPSTAVALSVLQDHSLVSESSYTWRPDLAILQRWCRVMASLTSVLPHVDLCAWPTVRLNTPNVSVWSRERFIAGPGKENRWLMPIKPQMPWRENHHTFI